MAGKPVVAMVLSPQVHESMFRQDDLARLGSAARIVGPSADAASREELLRDATVAITGWGSPCFDADLLKAAPQLRFIAYSAGSVKNLVSDAMYDRGIRISTSASANALPVAHFTIAMMISLLKQTPWLSTAYARGDQETVRARKPLARELQDIAVGIIGASRVGREVIRLLRGFPGVRIRLYDPMLNDAAGRELGVELCDLEDACRCEVVSIHAPKIPQTYHMFNARTLALLPDHAVLINTARGALVDEQALVAEMHRRPLYVALDVTDPEPPAADSPLRREPNIILTPHIAGALQQARRDMGKLAIDETLRFLKGEPLEHEVTREMLASQA